MSLKQFKAFENLNNIELAPLTVIVGRNSSGKSSILHSLLLLKQTIDSNNNNDSAILLEGKYLKYSSLHEVAYGLPSNEDARICFSFEIEAPIQTLIEISIKNKKDSIDEATYHPIVDYIKVTQEKSVTNFGGLTVAELKKKSKQHAKHFSNFLNEFKDVRVQYDHFIPTYFEFRRKKNENEKVRMPIEMLIPQGQPLEILKKNLSNIKYLSPVRAMPQRAYIHYSEDTTDLNEDGGNSAHVFWVNRNKKVKWLGEARPLSDAVNLCLKCMGLKQSITPSQSGIIYQIKVAIPNSEKKVTIVDVGFGYSQVIPIVLMGLLNDKRNLMLIEQPEIHLHPSSCANLADLFLGFVKDEKRFVIETHSHDFINRLRLRVIENPNLKSKINVLFIDNDNDGKATVKQFNIDENGSFPEWPPGFLDQSEQGARDLIKARAAKRAKESVIQP